MKLYCNSGQEVYPVHFVYSEKEEPYYDEIEVTEEEASFLLKTQEDQSKAHRIISKALGFDRHIAEHGGVSGHSIE